MSETRAKGITYAVDGIIATITLNLPEQFNALDVYEYQAIDEYVVKAAQEPGTVVTLIQATGKFFSAGANVVGASTGGPPYDDNLSAEDNFFKQRQFFTSTFGARNLSIANTFFEHPKVLICALNGPVIGLSSAIVALCDLIYAVDSAYLLTPFSNIGLVSEGATSYTLVQRLGLSLANEALLASKPINAKRLYERGFINKLFRSSEFKSTEEFNAHVAQIAKKTFEGLDPESVVKIKELIRRTQRQGFTDSNHAEIFGGIERFALGIPQKRFAALATKDLRHKL